MAPLPRRPCHRETAAKSTAGDMIAAAAPATGRNIDAGLAAQAR